MAGSRHSCSIFSISLLFSIIKSSIFFYESLLYSLEILRHGRLTLGIERRPRKISFSFVHIRPTIYFAFFSYLALFPSPCDLQEKILHWKILQDPFLLSFSHTFMSLICQFIFLLFKILFRIYVYRVHDRVIYSLKFVNTYFFFQRDVSHLKFTEEFVSKIQSILYFWQKESVKNQILASSLLIVQFLLQTKRNCNDVVSLYGRSK